MIPLKDNWRLPFSFIELWRNLNRTARWLNGMQFDGGKVLHNENGIRLVAGFGAGGSSGSFAYLSAKDDYLLFYGGTVTWSGRTPFVFEDGAYDTGYSGAYVQVSGGTEAAPVSIQIRMTASEGPASCVLISGVEQFDNGTYFFKTLGTAYLNDDGDAVFVRDRRNDWHIGSPI